MLNNEMKLAVLNQLRQELQPISLPQLLKKLSSQWIN